MTRFLRMVIFFIALAMLGMRTRNAYAYIDPGTGSYLLQILIASVVSGLFFVKLWWAKIKAFVFRKKPEANNGKRKP